MVGGKRWRSWSIEMNSTGVGSLGVNEGGDRDKNQWCDSRGDFFQFGSGGMAVREPLEKERTRGSRFHILQRISKNEEVDQSIEF